MRIAIKFGYNGSRFAGYQRQPLLPTVEGVIIEKCREIGAFRSPEEARFQSASRTDRGVHAIGNVVAFNTHFQVEELLDGLNNLCEDMLFHSYLEVPATFNPRHALMRHYRYLLYEKVVEEELIEALSLFTGRRDLRLFHKPSNRKGDDIARITVSAKGEARQIDIYARSFLYNMVRRIVAAATAVASGRRKMEELKEALAGREVKTFGLAKPDFLYLMDVDYGMRFRHCKVQGKIMERWLEFTHRTEAQSILGRELLELA
ncbi:MAG: tRNA pseudouridine(38-40) synthase TruA [Methanomassiliicoccales archaeon]